MPEEFFEPLSDTATPPTYKFFNGSAWISGTSGLPAQAGKTTPVVSPIDQSVIGFLPVATPAEIDEILIKLKSAQPAWEAKPLNQRVKMMHLVADWVRYYEAYLTTLLVREIGKSVSESKSEIVRTAELTDYFADEVQSIHGETIESDDFPGYDKGTTAMVERVAHGVVLCIAPFNYPVNLAASKIVPALLMGNTVIFKPPTQGGVNGLHLARIFEKAGIPPNIFACVTGTGTEIGDYLVSHKNVDAVAFTGSSDTGVAIAGKAPMKPLLFECGGNNPAVIFPDADMNLTAREIVKGGFSYAGQRCTAIKYVLATRGVLDALVPLVLVQMQELIHVGDPRSPETKLVGPVISPDIAQKIQGWIDESVGLGAKIVAGGTHENAYIQPTVLTGVSSSMPVVVNEVFGPVISFIEISSMGDAATIINQTRFGLQACVFTKDEGTGLVFAKSLNVGTVQINGSPQRGPDHFPFLGVKQSGIGVQGVRYSLEALSRLKPVVLNKPQ
jgi:glyceraldehyde-3-phosphate dehydrogenase (NADP+)